MILLLPLIMQLLLIHVSPHEHSAFPKELQEMSKQVCFSNVFCWVHLFSKYLWTSSYAPEMVPGAIGTPKVFEAEPLTKEAWYLVAQCR